MVPSITDIYGFGIFYLDGPLAFQYGRKPSQPALEARKGHLEYREAGSWTGSKRGADRRRIDSKFWGLAGSKKTKWRPPDER